MKPIKMFEEFIAHSKIECDNCGWTWKLEDGGDDLYTCHKCGHDNTSILGEGEVQSFSDGMNQMLKIGYKIELNSGDTGEIIGFNDKIATVLTGTGLEVQIDINTEIKQVLSQDEPTKDQIKIYNI